MKNILFLNKYQPLYFDDFVSDNEIIDILNTLIKIDNLNILKQRQFYSCYKTFF